MRATRFSLFQKVHYGSSDQAAEKANSASADVGKCMNTELLHVCTMRQGKDLSKVSGLIQRSILR
jgi:hypothetical protein